MKSLIETVKVWKLVIRKKSGKKVSSRLLSRVLNNTEITIPLKSIMQSNQSEAHRKLQDSYQAYREYCKKATHHRQTWLTNLAEARANLETSADDDGKVTAKHLRMIIALENTRRIFRRIHRTVGKTRQQGVSMVLVKNNQGEWIEQHEPAEIFWALMKEYKAKYHQTEHTPPMTTLM